MTSGCTFIVTQREPGSHSRVQVAENNHHVKAHSKTWIVQQGNILFCNQQGRIYFLYTASYSAVCRTRRDYGRLSNQ